MIAHLAACALTNHGIGEQPDCANYVHKTAGLLSDLPHLTTEAIVDIIENAVFFVVAWFIGRGALKREHLRQDIEHGVEHSDK